MSPPSTSTRTGREGRRVTQFPTTRRNEPLARLRSVASAQGGREVLREFSRGREKCEKLGGPGQQGRVNGRGRTASGETAVEETR